MGRRTDGKARMRKRTVSERELDLVDEARLYVRGFTQKEIADWISRNRTYTLSQSGIYKDLEIIRKRWRELYIDDINEMKMRELAKIDELERQAWEDLERSRKDYDELEHLTTTDQWEGGETEKGNAAQDRKYKRERVIRKRKQRDANTKFMNIIMQCIEKRVKIFGLDAPREVTVNWRQEAEAAGIDPDQYQHLLQQEFVNAAMRSKPEADE